MVAAQLDPFGIEIEEPCGFRHDPQVLEIPIPPEASAIFVLKDLVGGVRYPVQRSKCDPVKGYLYLGIEPFQKLKLVPDSKADAPGALAPAVSIQPSLGNALVISNGTVTLEVLAGSVEVPDEPGDWLVSGPVKRFKREGGPWRGRTFFDVRGHVLSWCGEIEEAGPLRIVYRFRARLSDSGWYSCSVTLDAGQVFARVCEEFQAGSGDQLVWDFSGPDLPIQIDLLNSEAGHTSRPLHYLFDQRLARLWAWTQYQQLFDLSDGFGLRFTKSDDVVGFVALEGGKWRGNRLNHLEAWTRRWANGKHATRRDVPSGAKADSFPSPERIPARGRSRCEPHLNLEGWLGSGERRFALVLAREGELFPGRKPGDDPGAELQHFEDRPDRERYRMQQGLLRKIQIQHGLMPLADMARMVFSWGLEEPAKGSFCYPNPILEEHRIPGETEDERTRRMHDYLQARVYGVWEGSGASYSNCVVGRRIAPEMYHFAWLVETDRIAPDQVRLVRAWFAFLTHLYDSDNYYPGISTMTGVESDESVEPTLEGMANQNFYTDVFNVPGTAAQVFRNHPEAERWRLKFGEMWSRQLDYHVYPESGLWEESHTYYQHVLHTVLPTHLRRKADGVDDGFADPRFRKVIGSALAQVTPRDAWFGDRRHLAAIGDHAVGLGAYASLYGHYAEAVHPHDPALAGNLAWLCREMGGTQENLVTPIAPEWRSAYVQGLGFMLRSADSSGQETLLALRCGSAWAHHHNDDGSIQFFARGRSLIVDSVFSESPAEHDKKYGTAGHSRWSLKEFEPVNYLWRFNRGWICAHDAASRFPYAVSYNPIFMFATAPQRADPMRIPVVQHRIVVQLAPTAFLLLDISDTALAQTSRFHVPGDQAVVTETGIRVDYAEDCRLTIIPALPEGLRPALSREEPASEKAATFVTTEICFDLGQARRSAYLICADGANDLEPSAESIGDHMKVHGPGFDAEMSVLSDRQIEVKDTETGQTTQIVIPPVGVQF